MNNKQFKEIVKSLAIFEKYKSEFDLQINPASVSVQEEVFSKLDSSDQALLEGLGWYKRDFFTFKLDLTQDRKGFVYFFKVADLIKIGMTSSPKQRIKTLKKEFGAGEFVCMFPVEDRYCSERKAHRYFAEYHVDGELFSINEEMALHYVERVQ